MLYSNSQSDNEPTFSEMRSECLPLCGEDEIEPLRSSFSRIISLSPALDSGNSRTTSSSSLQTVSLSSSVNISGEFALEERTLLNDEKSYSHLHGNPGRATPTEESNTSSRPSPWSSDDEGDALKKENFCTRRMRRLSPYKRLDFIRYRTLLERKASARQTKTASIRAAINYQETEKYKDQFLEKFYENLEKEQEKLRAIHNKIVATETNPFKPPIKTVTQFRQLISYPKNCSIENILPILFFFTPKIVCL
jgi:hypothetical protein